MVAIKGLLLSFTAAIGAVTARVSPLDEHSNEEMKIEHGGRSLHHKKTKTLRGKPGGFGNGHARTYATFDKHKEPIEVGIEMQEKFLDPNHLPQEESDGQYDIVEDGSVVWFCCGHELPLKFHPKARKLLPFEHFVMNWNPAGHGPPDIYTLPHFDFHFYTIDLATRLSVGVPPTLNFKDGKAVPTSLDDFVMLTQPLPEDQQPPAHVSVGAVEPAMGNHLIDFSGAEWQHTVDANLPKVDFTNAWIFGTQAGELSFWEPMVARDFIEMTKDEVGYKKGPFSIPTPAAAPEAGYYPTAYCVYYVPGKKEGRGVFRVALQDFIWLPESQG